VISDIGDPQMVVKATHGRHMDKVMGLEINAIDGWPALKSRRE
jgi:hypothetical protein